MRRFRSLPLVAQYLLGFLALAFLTGGSAVAALRITGRDVVDRSLTGRDIALSSITGANIRNRSLTARDFRSSIRGPQGPQGPQGARGNPGRNGFTLLSPHLSGAVPVAPNSVALGTAPCGAGEVVVSGGYTPGDAASLAYIPVYSAPDPSLPAGQEGWLVAVLNYGADPTSFKVFANCSVEDIPATATGRASSDARRRALSTRLRSALPR